MKTLVRCTLYVIFSVAVARAQAFPFSDCDSAKAAFDRISVGGRWVTITQSFGPPSTTNRGLSGDTVQTYVLPGCLLEFHIVSEKIASKNFVPKPGSSGCSTKNIHAQKKEETGSEWGFVVAPMVFKDEGCARDYARAFQFEGVELRKRLVDLEVYGCVDTTATGVLVGLSIERKDYAVEKENVAYFRYVIMVPDPERTRIAVEAVGAVISGGTPRPSGKAAYSGWIPDKNFYAVSAEEFDQWMAQKKIRVTIK